MAEMLIPVGVGCRFSKNQIAVGQKSLLCDRVHLNVSRVPVLIHWAWAWAWAGVGCGGCSGKSHCLYIVPVVNVHGIQSSSRFLPCPGTGEHRGRQWSRPRCPPTTHVGLIAEHMWWKPGCLLTDMLPVALRVLPWNFSCLPATCRERKGAAALHLDGLLLATFAVSSSSSPPQPAHGKFSGVLLKQLQLPWAVPS